jgi:hypothetical protein
MTFTFVLAACSVLSLSLAAPVHLNVVDPRSLVTGDKYVMFGGDGSRDAGWPAQEDWMNFEDAWYVSRCLTSVPI